MSDKGYVHIYTGNGKGKTTAAFGLAIRAHYAGKKVFIGQFVKSMKYHEVNIEHDIDNIVIEQFGRTCFINEDPIEIDKTMAIEGLNKMKDLLMHGDYDLLIFDEVTIAIYMNFFDDQALIDVINARQKHIEVVCTGRYASETLIEIGDLVTRMEEVKHYYQEGVQARDGIER